MDLRRLRAGEWIAAISGAVLIASLFLPWYSTERDGGTVELSAWEAYSVVDVLLASSGLLAVGLLVLTAIQRTAAVGVAADSLLTIVAAIVAIVTAIRVIDLPAELDALGAGRAAFAWIGLAAAFGVVAGTLLAMRDERLSRPGEHTDATGVPIEAPPEIETLPAPPREAAE